MTKNKKTLLYLIALCIAMFGFSFALIPFYNALCKSFGINGKTNSSAVINTTQVDYSRTITVQFSATPNDKLPWEFYPEKKSLDLHPGETIKIFYVAKNKADYSVTAQAIPSVTPGNAGQYFKKIECFCFKRQILKAHESIRMPVVFYIDPKLPKNIHEIALSYALYKVH